MLAKPQFNHAPGEGGSRILFRRGCTRLLLYFNTNKPHSFFLCRIPVVLENRKSSQRGRGGAPPAPSSSIHLCTRSHACQHHVEITQSHTFAALLRLSTTTHNLLTFNIGEISSNNSEKLSLLPDKHLWTFLLHSSYSSSRM